ncbi:MAG: SDR family NAD(P)-dependent oxidoreductase [Candidatus Marinimicrobia bacterium]|nr:SDR family NAD(P)-dependent oxidoreductase [Candidatus Neomarinimicrobiota bacterium]MBT4360190.1 SDR family NAD(P)-dependent oxidoreductase [Candidatus Neomarinimicrobiota bacterium]MBT4713679.1 SDR family NAD(P)-dependent oxidoreductase [Candidatus Neomarinimicrobiota bacterium]MBT4947533.1 SDR family NAD(P)-dependent oxidoreductase [Candidatus Neomarinimicrobiota bacterium]MBT5269062.1 SDR family NAD(P)-dependent oxidoreductase [Candidatus Neomarinimicrobiota bacterium]
MNRLKDKTILITGASAGIGEACARLFAQQGSNLIITARREQKLLNLASELQKEYQIQVLGKALDVRDSSAVESLISSLPDPFKHIDVLVNNAGLVLGVEKAHETPGDDVDTMLDTNVKGVLNMIRTVVPGMERNQRGHVINISSIAGHEAYPGGSIYCASKHAVDALTKSLRMDVVSTPLRVSAISPGLVDTEFSLVRFKGDASKAEAVYQGLEALVAEDIAEAVIFAASRPPHVQIADIIIFPAQQAAATVVYRGN